MVTINRADILAANDTKTEAVECPEWGGTVYVRTITGAERDRWEVVNEKFRDSPGTANIRGSLLALALCDEHGKPLFTPADAGAIGAKSAAVVDRLYDVAARLSGIGKQAVEDAKKNCSEAHGEGSS